MGVTTIRSRQPQTVSLQQVVDLLPTLSWRFAGEDVNATSYETDVEQSELEAAVAGDVARAIQDSEGGQFSDLVTARDIVAAGRYANAQKAIEISQAKLQVVDLAEVALRSRHGDLLALVEKEREKSRKSLLKANYGPESDPVYSKAPQVAERKFEHRVNQTSNVSKAMADAKDCKNELGAIGTQRQKCQAAIAAAEKYLADFRRRFIELAAR